MLFLPEMKIFDEINVNSIICSCYIVVFELLAEIQKSGSVENPPNTRRRGYCGEWAWLFAVGEWTCLFAVGEVWRVHVIRATGAPCGR